MYKLNDLLIDRNKQLHKLRASLKSDPSDSDYDCSNGNCPICYPLKRGLVKYVGGQKVVKLRHSEQLKLFKNKQEKI